MSHMLINDYGNGWCIQYGIFGLWKVFKGKEYFGTFGIYEDAEKRLRELQKEERCKQQNQSCSVAV